MREATLCFLVRGEPIQDVLMGYKKIGFGQGKYTGFGGKVEPGEAVQAAAMREMEEESGVRVLLEGLRRVGQLTFLFPHQPDWSQLVFVYLAAAWIGQPQESNEMEPHWFAIDEIPYAGMWQDGPYWLPPILEGKYVEGRFVFKEDNESLDEVKIEQIVDFHT